MRRLIGGYVEDVNACPGCSAESNGRCTVCRRQGPVKRPSTPVFNGFLYSAIGLVLLTPLVVVFYPIFGEIVGNAVEVIFGILIAATTGLLILIRGSRKS